MAWQLGKFSLEKNRKRITVRCWALLWLSSVTVWANANMETSIEFSATADNIRPEIISWWWDNIDNSERFQAWLPEENQSFRWLQAPADNTNLSYSIGASMEVSELIAGQPVVSRLTYLPTPAEASIYDERYAIAMKLEFPGYESNLEAGLIRYDYQPDESGKHSLISVTVNLPEGVEDIFPGYTAGFERHLKAEIANLATAILPLFKQDYLGKELLGRGAYQIEWKNLLQKRIIVNQEIKGLEPAMVNWWWDNIGTTRRYQRWHPVDHLNFEWRQAPDHPGDLEYSVGAVQKVREFIGPYRSDLLITWLDPANAPNRIEYGDYVFAKTDLAMLSGIFPQRMFHEYEANAAGDGIFMRSTFIIPSFLDLFQPGFSTYLAEHARQEMQMLQYFLPVLFAREYAQPE